MRSAIGNSASDPVYVAPTIGGVAPPAGTAADPQFTRPAPTSAAVAAIAPVVSVGVTGLVVKNSPGNFYGGSMIAGATAGYFIALDLSVVPSVDGALAFTLVLDAVPVAANGYASFPEPIVPDRFSLGVVMLFSTSLSTYTVPADPALYIRGRAA